MVRQHAVRTDGTARAEAKLALTMPNRRTSERNIKLVLECCRARRRKTKLIVTEEKTRSGLNCRLQQIKHAPRTHSALWSERVLFGGCIRTATAPEVGIENSNQLEPMSKYIIADAGYADHGKTSAIKAFARLVQSKYPESFKLIKDFENDMKAYVTIEGNLVGIESQGDPSS